MSAKNQENRRPFLTKLFGKTPTSHSGTSQERPALQSALQHHKNLSNINFKNQAAKVQPPQMRITSPRVPTI